MFEPSHDSFGIGDAVEPGSQHVGSLEQLDQTTSTESLSQFSYLISYDEVNDMVIYEGCEIVTTLSVPRISVAEAQVDPGHHGIQSS